VLVPLPAAVQRRVDDEAKAWANAYPDPDVADPVLRSAAHRFADATAPELLDVPSGRASSAWLLATIALVLAALAVLGLVLPLAAVPLLVVGALACLAVAWAAAAAAAPGAPSLDELRAALRAAAYRGVLARRSASRQPWAHPVGVSPRAVRIGSPVVLPPRAERGRATYEAAAHLVEPDTARVIDL
jgi:hypothetical protein